LRKQELLEFSIVTVPANPNALVQNSMAPAELSKKMLKLASKKTWTDLGNILPYLPDPGIVNNIVDTQDNIKNEFALKDINKKLDDILEMLKLPNEKDIPNIGEVDSHKTSDAPDQNQEPEQEESAKPVFFLKRGKKENE
jgi:hypothetical protein